MNWGQLLQIELMGCNVDILDSGPRVDHSMQQMVSAAGMKVVRVMDPYRELPRADGKGPGITCVCVLTESHCAVHTYPDRKAAFITFLTCGEMDSRRVAEFAAAEFEAADVEFTVLPVGTWWDEGEKQLAPIEPFVLVDLLSLASITVNEDTVEEWTQDEREEAASWASAVHADAGDNDVANIPTKPAFLPATDPFVSDFLPAPECVHKWDGHPPTWQHGRQLYTCEKCGATYESIERQS